MSDDVQRTVNRLLEMDQPAFILAERGLLGAIMICGDVGALPNWLRPKDFHDPRHEQIYAAILRLRDDGRKVDFITVCNELDRKDLFRVAGGIAYVSGLIDRVPDVENIVGYAEDVKDASRRRTLARLKKMSDGGL